MTANSAPRRDYGPVNLAEYLGTFYSQVDRAWRFGLLPEKDRGGGRRWSIAAAEQIRGQWPEIAAQVECIGAPGLKRRGWTEAMIRDLLGQPDEYADNPHYKSAAPRRLWLMRRVTAAEAGPGFAGRKERAARQCAAAAKGAEVRAVWRWMTS